MNQKKSPDLDLARGKKESRECVAQSYVTPRASVKPECASCFYFRVSHDSKRPRSFCSFTGESVPSDWWCEFYLLASQGATHV